MVKKVYYDYKQFTICKRFKIIFTRFLQLSLDYVTLVVYEVDVLGNRGYDSKILLSIITNYGTKFIYKRIIPHTIIQTIYITYKK